MEPGHADPFIDAFREMIERRLVAGRPPIGIVSREVAMSVRTLQRRLGERGWSYSELVDDVRRVVARRRVSHRQILLKAVATDLGFSEQASFTRAFRRWTGLTPREYRRREARATAMPPAGSRAGNPIGLAASG